MTRRTVRAERAHPDRPRPDQAILLALLLDLVAAHGTGHDAHGRMRHPATTAALARLVPTGADEPARAAIAARRLLRPLALDLLRTAGSRTAGTRADSSR